MVKKRVLVSFDGECPYYCKHCYTYGLKKSVRNRTISEIVDSVKEEEFDIIYVSQRRENFVVPEEGLELCEALFERYHKDLIAITRNVFDTMQIERLSRLNQKMLSEGRQFFLSVSIPALESADVTENLAYIPSPEERIDFLHRVSDTGIKTFLMLRPLYPEKIIPIAEILELVNKCKEFVSGVVSSGLVTNISILEQLGFDEKDFEYSDNGKSDYLVGAIEDTKYVDVKKEMKLLSDYCCSVKVPFFEHSMPAINYVKGLVSV